MRSSREKGQGITLGTTVTAPILVISFIAGLSLNILQLPPEIPPVDAAFEGSEFDAGELTLRAHRDTVEVMVEIETELYEPPSS